MSQPDADRDAYLLSRLHRIERAIAACGSDRRVLLVLQNDLRLLLETLRQRSGEMAAKINRAAAQSSAAKAYARCATFSGAVQRKIIKERE